MAKFKIGQEVQISSNADIALMKKYACPIEARGKSGIIIESKFNYNFNQHCYMIRIDTIAGRWYYLESMLTNYKTLNDLVINP